MGSKHDLAITFDHLELGTRPIQSSWRLIAVGMAMTPRDRTVTKLGSRFIHSSIAVKQ